MRKIYKDFFTEEEAKLVEKLDTHTNAVTLANKYPFNKVLKTIRKDFNVAPVQQSFFNVEQKSKGHKWHKDTGTSNHMMWCRVGGSIILQAGSGGDTYYADDDKETNKVKSERGLYDLVLHTSDEWHMVEPNDGNRKVLLIFI